MIVENVLPKEIHRECTAKGNTSEDDLCGQSDALESPLKLK